MKWVFKLLFLFGITVVLDSCWTGKQISTPYFYNNPEPILDNVKLRFDGFYTSYFGKDESYLTSIVPLVFSKNNKIKIIEGATMDTEPFTCDYYKRIKKMGPNFGTYILKGDSILAFAPAEVAVRNGMYYTHHLFNFSGIMGDNGAILNWHAIPPYP